MVELPHEPHSAIICGQTGCGKTQFVLDELLHPDKGIYRDREHSRMSLSYAPHGDVTKHIWNDHGSGGTNVFIS